MNPVQLAKTLPVNSQAILALTGISSLVLASAIRVNVRAFTGATKWVEFKALENATWCAKPVPGVSPGYTPSQVIALLEQVHNAIGNFNLVRIMRSECPPKPGTWAGRTPADLPQTPLGDGYNIKSFLAACQVACGGKLVVDLDMDSYPGVSNDCCKQPVGTIGYPCAQTPAEFFVNNAQSLFNCCPPGTICWLEAWSPGAFDHVVNNDWSSQPQYFDDLAPSVGTPQSQYIPRGPSYPSKQAFINNFFDTLKNMGWQQFMFQSNASTDTLIGNVWRGYSYGRSQFGNVGIRIGGVDLIPPYVHPDLTLIRAMKNREPQLTVFTSLQVQPSNGISVSSDFRTKLNQPQRIAALTSLFQNQRAGGYTFIAPLLQVQDITTPVYDSVQDGTLPTIETLLKAYN